MANLGGRPKGSLKIESEEELVRAINEYFDFCDNRTQQVYSAKADGIVEVIDPEPYTMSGLAGAMGIDRRTLLNYTKDERFFSHIKAARNKVERDVERRLMEGKAQTGAIFNLKNNFDWKDQTQQDINHSGNVSFINDVPRPDK
jgi:hypothetical protein